MRSVGNDASHREHIRLRSVDAGQPFGLNFNYCVTIREIQMDPAPNSGVSCFYRAGGIYSTFARKRVARQGGRKPTFLLPPVR